MNEQELLPMPAPLDLSGATLVERSQEEVQKDRLFNGGPGLVKNNEGIWVDENRIVPGGMRAGDFYRLSPTEQQEYRNRRIEQQAAGVDSAFYGLFGQKKPKWMPGAENLAQVVNGLSSPQFFESLLTGGVNGVSKFGNALGDLVQGKEVDVSDAWLIDEKALRPLNVGRYSSAGFQADNTSADEAGAPWGRMASAEIAGLAATGGTANIVRRIPMVTSWMSRANSVIQNSRRVQQLSLASQTGARVSIGGLQGPRVQTLIGGANLLRDGLASTAAATVFMDPKLDGNSANSLDGVTFDASDRDGIPFLRQVEEGEEGIELPGRVSEDDNYLEAWRKTVVVDGLLAPLAIFGGLSSIKPVRTVMLDGNIPRFMQEMEQVDLRRYQSGVARNSASTNPGMVVEVPVREAPTGDGVSDFAKPLNATTGDLATPVPEGLIADPWDSAIDRSTAASVQSQQVAAQRQRLVDMGLATRTVDGQLELTFPQNVDPAVTARIEELQAARAKANEAGDKAQLAQLDADIEELSSGRGLQPVQGQPDIGPADFVDTRPEISTYLAELDELSDAQLKELLPKVSIKEQLAAREEVLRQAQARVDAAEGKIAEINERLALPEGKKNRLTEKGAKRLLNKANAELETARLQLSNITAEPLKAENVGKQLALSFEARPTLDFGPGIELPPIRDMEWDEATEMWRPSRIEGGYPSLQAYREDISGWDRLLLRRMAMPESSPAVAAIVKARTGRRVWSAKKSDIVDAFVEYASRTKRYAVMPEQLPIEGLQQGLNLNDLTVSGESVFEASETVQLAGPATSLPGVTDAPAAPGVPYRPRGLTAEAREEMKRKILEAALENGEVQGDKTPIPKTPEVKFNQSEFIDVLMDDETGQMAWDFASGVTPLYEVGGKNAYRMAEEVRARMGWAELDNRAQLAARRDYWQAKIYEDLDFETAKKMQILDDDFWNPPTLYVEPETVKVPDNNGTPSIPVLQKSGPETPTEASYYQMPWPGGGDLMDIKPGLERVFRWRPKGLVPEAIAEVADEAEAAAKPKRSRRSKKKVEPTNSREALDAAPVNAEQKKRLKASEDLRKKLLAKRERAAKLAEEASC